MSGFILMYYICLPITFLCIFGFCRNKGVWEILVKLFALFFATAFALTLFEPLANLLDKKFVALTYYNDMWAFLIIFALVLFVELFITNKISKINVQLPAKPNKIAAFSLMFVMFLGLYFVSAQLFYFLMPEKPDKKWVATEGTVTAPIQFKIVEFVSTGSLSGKQAFDYADFYKRQFNRKSAVYTTVTTGKSSNGKAVWAFKNASSPNAGE